MEKAIIVTGKHQFPEERDNGLNMKYTNKNISEAFLLTKLLLTKLFLHKNHLKILFSITFLVYTIIHMSPLNMYVNIRVMEDLCSYRMTKGLHEAWYNRKEKRYGNV